MTDIRSQIAVCTLCADRFALTATHHAPRPVVWFAPSARILIAGQAPGARVHASGQPFTDPSGDRLRAWMGVDAEDFYDRAKVAIVPMAFCFPGYDVRGADLPPPPICARTWRASVLASLPNIRLTLVIGSHAMRYHLGRTRTVSEAVRSPQAHGDAIFALPHPSWRNTGWIRKNPWFETDVLPALRACVEKVMNDD